jgi:hypothetical protein
LLIAELDKAIKEKQNAAEKITDLEKKKVLNDAVVVQKRRDDEANARIDLQAELVAKSIG